MKVTLTVRKDHAKGKITNHYSVLLQSMPHKFDTLIYGDIAYTVFDTTHFAVDEGFAQTSIEVVVKQQ